MVEWLQKYQFPVFDFESIEWKIDRALTSSLLELVKKLRCHNLNIFIIVRILKKNYIRNF